MSLNSTILLTITPLFLIGFVLLARRLSRPGVWLLGVLLVVGTLLTALTILNWPSDHTFFGWFVDMVDQEKNGATLLAAVQLALLGTIALYHARRIVRHWKWRDVYWLLFAIVFLMMGADEYFEIHEPFQNWEYIYGGVGVLLAIATVAAFRIQWPEQTISLVLIVGGLALMALGGIVVEDFVLMTRCFDGLDDCFGLQAFEELFEFTGSTLVLVGVIEHVRYEVVPVKRQQMVRVGIIAALFWSVVFAANLYVQPAFEARWLATDVDLQYLDDGLELIGYRVPQEPLRTDAGTFKVILYWRANRHLPAGYGMSMHLVQFPDIAVATQNDIPILTPPVTAWLPGQISRQVMEIPIPADLQAPRDYWLTLSIWQRPWYDHNYIPVGQTDRELLLPQTLILQTVHAAPALSEY